MYMYVHVGLGRLVITVLSQKGSYHSSRAREKREQWLEQLAPLSKVSISRQFVFALQCFNLTRGVTCNYRALLQFC